MLIADGGGWQKPNPANQAAQTPAASAPQPAPDSAPRARSTTFLDQSGVSGAVAYAGYDLGQAMAKASSWLAASSTSSTSSSTANSGSTYINQLQGEINDAQTASQNEGAETDTMDYMRRMELEARQAALQKQVNTQVPLTPDQQVVYNKLNPPAQQAYQQLPTDQRNQFANVWIGVGGDWAAQTQDSQNAANGLQTLLVNGQLTQTDSQGNTMLADLDNRVGKPLAPQLQGKGVDGTGQLQGIIDLAANPNSTFQGDNTNTCVPSSVLTVMGNTQPAELVRVATGLVFDGSVSLQGPQDGVTASGSNVVHLSTSALYSYDGGRGSTSELLQQSFFDYAGQFPPNPAAGDPAAVAAGGRYGSSGTAGGGRYGSSGAAGEGRYGSSGTAAGGRYGSSGAAGGAPGGLTPFQAQQLLQFATGTPTVPVNVTDSNRDAVWNNVQMAVNSGTPVSVQVPNSQGEWHEVTVTGISADGNTVTIQDSGAGGTENVDAATFKNNLNYAVLPAEYVDLTMPQIMGQQTAPQVQNSVRAS